VHAAIVPLAPAHSALHRESIPLGLRHHRAPMSPLIAPMAGRHDVCHAIAAPVALRHEVFGGALQQSGSA